MSEDSSIVKSADTEDVQGDIMIDWMALTEGLHESWADWMPFLVFGMPYVKIADIFKIDKSTITNALKFNKDFARRVAQGRKMVKRQLHYLWLDQRAVSAWKNVDYFLSLDPYAKDEDGRYIIGDAYERRTMFTEKAKMSRFVLQQLGLHVQRHEVLHHTPQPMFLGDETLAKYVVERVSQVMNTSEPRDVETIVAEYRALPDGIEDGDFKEIEPDGEELEIDAAYEKKSKVWAYDDISE